MSGSRAVPLLAAAALALLAPAAAAQDSVFGIHGLGFLGLEVSARSEGMGGGEGMFDGASVLNPASLAAFHNLAGWAVTSGSSRSFTGGGANQSTSSMRFPLFGFAVPAGSRIVLGLAMSNYLDRNWNVTSDTIIQPRDSAVAVTDKIASIGGVTDIRLGAAYRVSERIAVGLGLHVLSGSARTTVERTFPKDSIYRTFLNVTETDYRGLGVSFGLVVSPFERLILSASARFNGRLQATAPNATDRVSMPTELGAGLFVSPVDGVTLSSSVTHASWSTAAAQLVAAGQQPSRDVWSVGAGLDVGLLRMYGGIVPLRVGYRWRQLPFPVPQPGSAAAAALSERALSGGMTIILAGSRASMDLALEGGSRTAGALKETFTSFVLGVTIYP